MTPDLTTSQTIGLASAIVGFCLTVFFTTLIVLTYGHQIRRYLRARGLLVHPRPLTPAHLPFHYVLPHQQPEPARGQLADLAPYKRQTETLESARRRSTTYVASLSEELLQNREEPGPRNATPGPAMFHVLQPRPPTTGTYWPDTSGSTNTHPPTPNLVYRSGLWYRTDLAPGWNIPVPSPYSSPTPSMEYPSNFPTQRPAPRSPSSDSRTPLRTLTSSPSQTRERTMSPSSESEGVATPLTPMPATMTGPISPRLTGRYSALSGSERGSSDSETSTEDWRDAIGTPEPDNPWTDSSPRTGAIPWSGPASRPRSPREYSPTATAPSFVPHLEGIDLITFDPEPRSNNDSWRINSGPYPFAFETDFSRRATETGPIPFTYDRETFPFPPSQNAEDFYVQPMRDSPPVPPRRAEYAPNPRDPG